MSAIERANERRAAQLLRCYPPSWRARYGDEFTQLLVDEMAERPWCPSRTANVMRNGALARFSAAGLTGEALGTHAQVRASLITVGCALAAFMAFGLAAWSQLTIGWQWSAPHSSAIGAGMVLMSLVVPALAVLALLAATPIAWTLGASMRSHRDSEHLLAAPLLLFGCGLTVLVLGGIYFDHGWPGTGGHQWADQGLVPDAVARFFWSSTLWITSYWAHPGALGRFPAAEIGWMVVSPLALLATVLGAVKAARCLSLSPRVLRYEIRLAALTAAAMVVFLAGACSWAAAASVTPHRLFAIGAIDVVGLVVMAAALVFAWRVLERALTALKRQPIT